MIPSRSFRSGPISNRDPSGISVRLRRRRNQVNNRSWNSLRDLLVAGVVAQIHEFPGIAVQIEQLRAETFVQDVFPANGAQHVGPTFPGMQVQQGARTPAAEVDLAHRAVTPFGLGLPPKGAQKGSPLHAFGSNFAAGELDEGRQQID